MIVIGALLYVLLGVTALAFMLERPEEDVPTPSFLQCLGIVLLAPPLIVWDPIERWLRSWKP